MSADTDKKTQLDRIILYARSIGVKVDSNMFFALAYRSADELKRIANTLQKQIPHTEKL